MKQSPEKPLTSWVAAILLPFPRSLTGRLFGVLLSPSAPTSPDLGQTPPVDGRSIAANANDATTQLQVYLYNVANGRGPPDLVQPPGSNLFSRIFDFGRLAALPLPGSASFLDEA